MTSDNSAELDQQLKALLDASGFSVRQVDSATYDVPFKAELREWTVTVRLTESWVLLRTYVMRLPQIVPVRLAFLQSALKINADLVLGKMSIEDDALYLDIEYRADDLDASALRSLLQLAVDIGDAEFPSLFRIASGDATLRALESSFQQPKTA